MAAAGGYALKHSDVVVIHHHHNKGALWGPYTLSTPQKITSASLRGCNLFIQSVSMEGKASCGALGGHFRRRWPWLWWLWLQLCFVIRLLKISIKTLKLVFCNQFLYVLLCIEKHIIIHVSLIVAWTEPELYGGQSPNHFGPMYPGILGIAGKHLQCSSGLRHGNERVICGDCRHQKNNTRKLCLHYYQPGAMETVLKDSQWRNIVIRIWAAFWPLHRGE